MRKFLLFFTTGFILCASSINAKEVKPGELFHITGCEHGKLLVPVVNMWSMPGGIVDGATVVGKLSGDGRPKCQGSVVKALETQEHSGRTFIKIKTIVGSDTGWITDSFVGKRFDRSKCKKVFSDPAQVVACVEK